VFLRIQKPFLSLYSIDWIL